jgi:predicted Zn finger-like uncharacterized protein
VRRGKRAGSKIKYSVDVLLRGLAENVMPGAIMRIYCANCSTEYDVPNAAFRGGARKLRCGRCRHEWFGSVPIAQRQAAALVSVAEVMPEAAAVDDEPPVGMWPVVRPAPAEPIQEPVVAARREAMLRPETTLPKQSRWPGLVLLFLVMAVLLVLTEHREVVRALPRTSGFFAGLGLN